MKLVYSVVGARPNYMKIAPIHRAFQAYGGLVEHRIIHTGQHYGAGMSDAFFRDLEMPEPAAFLGVGSGTHAEQTARVLTAFEKVCTDTRPDLVLVAGDVNSTLAAALAAVKLGIPVGHVEGGLRSFDRAMPEEINRVATDAISEYCFVTEESGLENLRREGYPEGRMFLVGNTMIDSLERALPAARRAAAGARLGLEPGSYALVTLHRPSNVDDPVRLRSLLEVLAGLSARRRMVLPLHPRTRRNISGFGLDPLLERAPELRVLEPLGYIDFVSLMLQSDFVLTDSGGIQEETTALGIPCLTMRTTTERPVTCRLGTNVMVRPDAAAARDAIARLLDGARPAGRVPPLWDGHAAERIAAIVVKTCLGLAVDADQRGK